MNIAKLIQMVLTASVMLIVCSLGMKATLQEVTAHLFQRWRQFTGSVLAMFIIMPVVAGILVYALSLPPALDIAFVALAVSPVPPVLPRKALAAGGSRSYVLRLFVAAAITSILFIPVEVDLTEMIFGWPDRMSLGAIARVVTISIIAPLGVGLALRRVAPGFAERWSEPLSRFSTLLLIISVLPVLFTQGSAAISLIGNGTLLAIAIFVTVGLIAGNLLGGPDASDRTVLALSTASRHPGIAMAIASTNFPDQKLVLPAILLYLIVNAILSWVFLRWFRPKEREGTLGGRQSAA
jgi:BASS family bile acid:Na+ symporter